MKIFAVKDMKAQLFLQPNASRSVADASRSFEVVANEGDSMIARFPQDYRLYHLADMDMETGVISVLEHPSDLGSALDFKKRPQPDMFDKNAV